MSKIFFNGKDAGHIKALWVTDGTNTTKLAEFGDNTSPGPTDIAALGGSKGVVFNALGAGHKDGLWFSDGIDGTTAHTYQIKNIANAGVNTTDGFDPHNMTSFAGQVLFNANDINNVDGLWITDGTAVGTTEISTDATHASNFVAFGSVALFEAQDSNGYLQLWRTDGTATGTYEIKTKLIDDPTDMTVLGRKVLFNGYNPSTGTHELWATNGTDAGTYKVYGDINPKSMTALGHDVLFSSGNATGLAIKTHVGLWISDGTTAGTHEITGIAGASATTMGIDPWSLVTLGNHVLFNGYDSNNQRGLWITDGTGAGTHELAGTAGLNPTDLTVVGDQVYFNGVDSNGHHGLWVTDGMSATPITVVGASNSGLNPTYITHDLL